MAAYNLPQLQAELRAAGASAAACLDGDRVYLVGAGGAILAEKDWPKGAAAVISAHVPQPAPTQPERFDAVVTQAQQALAKASTVDQIKAVFAGTLDGLKALYGTGNDT